MKKNRLLYILTLLLVIIGVLFMVNRRYTTLDDSESGFAVADTAKITKIFMAETVFPIDRIMGYTGLMLGISLIAGLLPGYRASRIAPSNALRYTG